MPPNQGFDGFRKVKNYMRPTGKYLNGRTAGENGKTCENSGKSRRVDKFAIALLNYLEDSSICTLMNTDDH